MAALSRDQLRRAAAEALGGFADLPAGPLSPPELPPIDLLLARPTGAVIVSLATEVDGAGEGGPALARGLAQRAYLAAWAGTFPGVGAGPVRLDVVAASFDPATRWAAAGEPEGSVRLLVWQAPAGSVLAGQPGATGLRLTALALPAADPSEPMLPVAALTSDELAAFADYRPLFMHVDRHADA